MPPPLVSPKVGPLCVLWLLCFLPVKPNATSNPAPGLYSASSHTSGRDWPVLETLLEQGLLQLPQLLRDQATRSQELWRALDQRLQQQLDAMEARLALRLESLKGDVTKSLAVHELLREDVGQLQRGQATCHHQQRCPNEQGVRRGLSSMQATFTQLQKNVTELLKDVRHIRNHSYLATTHKQLLDAVSHLEQSFSHVQVTCTSRAETTSTPLPLDCWDILQDGHNTSGVYRVQPSGSPEPLVVYCDMDTDGGGWTVVQRRLDGSMDFQKGWTDYKHGFGNIAGEFWLGNSRIHQLTTQKLCQVRVDIEDFEGQQVHAKYAYFAIGNEREKFVLKLLGKFDGGDAGDGLSAHAAMPFSTWDVDNDEWSDGSCARDHHGAWWYNQCGTSSLNGDYIQGPGQLQLQAPYWLPWPSVLRTSSIKLRPVYRQLNRPQQALKAANAQEEPI
ncbi:fibrinogen beta chain-like isoform X1 [Amblyomma americanum]